LSRTGCPGYGVIRSWAISWRCSLNPLPSPEATTARYAQIYASEREQREKVETAVRMRDDILHLGTHDLRAPATSVVQTRLGDDVAQEMGVQ
jgi:hypothetical protein